MNKAALSSLPAAESWPIISREMFSKTPGMISLQHTHVTHFGASCQGIEDEWKHWLEQFENLLRKMYWVSATVHRNRNVWYCSFIWHTDKGEHQPGVNDIKIRCEWIHDA
ncbi:MAG: hypothetical protein R3E73_11810 [Porticoccaceae bacterium]